MGCQSALGRQANPQVRSGIGVYRFNRTGMCFHDRLDDGQSEARAAGALRACFVEPRESLEDLPSSIWSYPWPVIDDVDDRQPIYFLE